MKLLLAMRHSAIDWERSRAILIGVANYRDHRFPSIAAATNSLTAMHKVLTDPELCGWPTARVSVLSDPSDSREVATRIRRLAQETSGVLLLYYVGHGTLTPRGELCLSVADTDADVPDLTGVEYARIRSALYDSPALVKAAILDCCYAGRAIETLANEAAAIADHIDIRGVYTLTASDLAAHVPPPEKQSNLCTSFTGVLVELIRTGIAGRHDPLTLGDLYLELRRQLRARGLPDPNQRGTDTAHSFAFTRNAAARRVPGGGAIITSDKMSTGSTGEATPKLSDPGEPDVAHSSTTTVKPNAFYKLSRVPLGEGTFSQVFLAEHRTTGERVALKRARLNTNARSRIQREIAVQLMLAPHPNIMPILDHDPGFRWYTMPAARGTLKQLREELNEDDLASIIADLSGALEAAHQHDLVHRDISPMNILALSHESGSGLQWVIADWGLVRRPYGTNSPRLTRTGAGAGTPGFDAPELMADAQNATAAADVYSLGRVAAWFLTRTLPISGQPLLPDGPSLHWRMFVKSCTENDLKNRLTNMPALRSALTTVFMLQEDPPAIRIERLLNDVIDGHAGLKDLMTLAAAFTSDADLYFDLVARVPIGQLRRWAQTDPSSATKIAVQMAQHLRTSPWGSRDPESMTTPLMFVFAILQALAEAKELAHAMDVAISYFAADAAVDHPRQRDRTVLWLSSLQAPSDAVVAQALAGQASLVDYYRAGASPLSFALRSIFKM
ncbi:caspase, EACC1-associated type [Nonomuraea dietziae]|uniref:caspase, EACC1-associated type n=1 Tax=Nonomuraea dietziae TaxID=65515 RepID=UPI003419CB3D